VEGNTLVSEKVRKVMNKEAEKNWGEATSLRQAN